MTYIEYSTSAGHGTLVEHGVKEVGVGYDNLDQPITPSNVVLVSQLVITPERYSEFISIHGGERAI